jgi:hypothetical protein
MSSVSHPDFDRLFLDPNLLTPNRKPIGPVEIDTDNPLNDGLIAAFVLNNSVSDLTGFNDPLVNDAPFRSLENGVGLDLNGSTYLTYSGGNLSKDVTTQVTMEYLVTGDNTTTDYIGGQHDQAGADGYNSYKITGGGSFQFGIVVGSGAANKFFTGTGITASTGTLYHVVTVYNGDAGRMEVFVDGVSAGSTSSGVPASLVMPTTRGFALGAQDSAGTLPWAGDIYYAKFWDRALSDVEITELSRDRYSFLKPKGSTLLPIAAAATGRIMGSLAGSGGLAGHGGIAGHAGGLAG